MPRTNTFFIGCLPPATRSTGYPGWKAKPEVTLPQLIDAAVSHRLMQWVDINEIQKVITATPLVVPGGATVLIDLDSNKGPLLAVAPREGFEDLVLGMVLVEQRTAADGSRAVYRNTDWPWRASFASFVFNLLTDRAGGPDLTGGGSYRPGMPVTVDAPAAGTEAQRSGLDVQVPSGATVHLPPVPRAS